MLKIIVLYLENLCFHYLESVRRLQNYKFKNLSEVQKHVSAHSNMVSL